MLNTTGTHASNQAALVDKVRIVKMTQPTWSSSLPIMNGSDAAGLRVYAIPHSDVPYFNAGVSRYLFDGRHPARKIRPRSSALPVSRDPHPAPFISISPSLQHRGFLVSGSSLWTLHSRSRLPHIPVVGSWCAARRSCGEVRERHLRYKPLRSRRRDGTP